MKKIDNYKVISTAKGDKGFSRNYSNDLIKKTDILFETIGDIDELSSTLGVTFHMSKYKDYIKTFQLDLQNIMSLIATNTNDVRFKTLRQITTDDISKLEKIEMNVLDTCNILPKFILPGSDSTQESAYLDLSRSICRRVERKVNLFVEAYQRDDLDTVKAYINRLSDLLYILARSCD